MYIILPDFSKQFHGSHEIPTVFTQKAMLIANTTPPHFIKCECDELKSFKTNLTSVIKSEKGNVCEASYKVSYHITHCGEAHTNAKNLIILRV
jgi:hypothetical protein